MSCEVTKVCYRFPIPHLDGASVTEAYKFFSSSLGEAGDVVYRGDDNNEILYFEYDAKGLAYEKVIPEEFISFVNPVLDDNGTWGIETIISIMRLEGDKYNGFQPGVLSGEEGVNLFKVVHGLVNLGFTEEMVNNGKIYSYTWYNGVDEPIYFK